MERLTEKIGNTNCVKGCGSNCKYGFQHCSKEDWENCKTIDDVIDKLAQYEDLEEQGLLLRLPCKVGTSVYMVEQDCGDALDCMREDCEGCPYLYSFVEENKFDAYMLENIGNTVFLTKSEAEQKLKEMECD